MDSEIKEEDAEMDMDDSESNSNSSNSPEGNSEGESVDDEKIAEIQEQIRENPYLYDLHVQLITLLRKSCDLDRLREAREEMSKLFPLMPELWIDWLTDEEKVAVTSEEKDSVIKLFERAVKDYNSVSVWLEYVQFILSFFGSEGASTIIRNTFEKALASVGIHVVQGSLIWDAYREFECAILKSLEEADDVSKEEIKQQENKLFGVYKRQLSVPLMYMDKTYEEFKKSFEHKKDDVKHLYGKALKKLETIQCYENAIFQSEPPHLKEYQAYIAHEIEKGDPGRVQNLYERALIENCLIPELWIEYTKYLDNVVRIENIVLAVHEKAVRNCPWSLLCWKNYTFALERYKQPHDVIKGAFEKAFNAGFSQGEEHRELWLGYIDYMRRCLDEAAVESREGKLKELNKVFERASEHVMSYFKDSDPQCSILQYWAKVQAKYCNDILRAREIWNDIMNQGHHKEAEMWLNYANFERKFGDEKHYRKVLLKGLHSASDWPESIGNILLIFEREEGTLESLEVAIQKYETQMKRIEERRQKIADKEAELLLLEVQQKKQNRAEKRASKQPTYIKFHRESKSDNSDVNMDSDGFKIPQRPASDHRGGSSGTMQARKRPAPREEGGSEHSSKKQKVEENEEHGSSVRHDSLKDERSVFLSNLAYTVEEGIIKDMFSSVGDIEEVRLVKDFKGRSKGFCYVVFTTIESARKALKKDRERLEGRPVFVSRCEDKKSSRSNDPKFKFKTTLEKNKLFIKNLPYSKTEEDLTNLFKEYGSLKEVRLVTYRNGHSKGLAYIEYNDESSASTALLKTDGMKIDEHVISVAFSNPPERKLQPSNMPKPLGAGMGSSGPRGRGRTQVALIPRSVRRPATQQQRLPPKDSTSNGSTDSVKKQLGNEDFRQMLLKK